jgi:hypothetical protein
MKNLITKIKILLGMLSPCCAAATVWDEGYGQEYCSACNKRIF